MCVKAVGTHPDFGLEDVQKLFFSFLFFLQGQLVNVARIVIMELFG